MDEKTKALLDTWLTGLARECPEGGNPEDCQLHEFRKLPFRERMARLAAMPESTLVELYENHVRCHRREAKGGECTVCPLPIKPHPRAGPGN
jgi:hypothetical protein